MFYKISKLFKRKSIIYIENLKKSTNNLLKLMTEFNKIVEHKVKCRSLGSGSNS